ncbi:MAG: cation:proton antiporter subunit C [Parvularculaceae bacterium]
MDILGFALERYNYWIFVTLMMMGLYIVIARSNLIKKLIGLNLFQTSVFIYYISIGKIAGGTAPIYLPDDLKDRAGEHAAIALPGKPPLGAGALFADPATATGFDLAGTNYAALTAPAAAAPVATEIIYSNPLPHVLILTAIVVGVATTAVGLALVVRIREAYGTIEEDELEAADNIAAFGAVKDIGLVGGPLSRKAGA